jgi:REP-associated tyrosine transposase
MRSEEPPKPAKKRGGKRPGAGRPKSGRRGLVAHRARPSLSANTPVHVTMRLMRSVQELRQRRMYKVIRDVMVRYLGRGDFRIVHLSIQSNHLHLLVEAANQHALSTAMQSFAISCARALNAATHRRGKVFEFRYHATQIRTARQARNCLAYVLNNWRRHLQDFANGKMMTAKLDEYSSAISFDGWAGGYRFGIPADYDPLPVSPPRTRLLARDWRRHGLIDVWECPGPLR